MTQDRDVLIEPLLWNIGETAHQLGVSTRTVRRMLVKGQLGGIRIGRSVRISVQSVRDFVEKQAIPAQNSDCVGSAMRKGGSICHINAKTVPYGGHHTPTQAAKELDDLLERRTKRKQ